MHTMISMQEDSLFFSQVLSTFGLPVDDEEVNLR
jgi:hypothetical protein